VTQILLINPPRYKGMPVIREDRCENIDIDCVHPPTSLVYLAGVLREQGFKVDLLDANVLTYPDRYNWAIVEAFIKMHKPAWVIFRATPSTFYHDIKVVKLAKKYGAKTLMLCWNLHHVPEKVKQECPDLDIYCNLYHYEYAIEPLISGYKVYWSRTTDIPPPAWDLIPDFNIYYTRTKWMSPWAVVRGSKGCYAACKFCVDATTGWHPRSPDLIGDELEYLVKRRRVKYISFFDNTFEVDADWCLDIAEEIIRRKLKFKWYINSRADLICKHGVKFFKLLHEAGLDGSSIGIEFGSQEMLDASGKGTTVEQNYEAIRILHKAGVKSYVSCMMGYLDETREQMEKTKEFIIKAKPTGFQINIVVPYHGTRLYEDAYRRGLIDESKFDWRGLSCVPTDRVPVKLSRLEIRELLVLRRKFYRDIYFSSWLVSNILRLRSLDDLKLGLGYFLANMRKLARGVVYSH